MKAKQEGAHGAYAAALEAQEAAKAALVAAEASLAGVTAERAHVQADLEASQARGRGDRREHAQAGACWVGRRRLQLRGMELRRGAAAAAAAACSTHLTSCARRSTVCRPSLPFLFPALQAAMPTCWKRWRRCRVQHPPGRRYISHLPSLPLLCPALRPPMPSCWKRWRRARRRWGT